MLLYSNTLLVVLLHYSLLYGSTGAETTFCPTVYTVDAANVTAARDCSQLMYSYSNITCSSLQDLLNIISQKNASSDRESEGSTCVEIRILRGHHVITSNFTFIGHNLILVGDGVHVTTISFNLSDVFDPRLTDSPLYVLSFIDSSLIEIRDLSFLESPGIITAINVESVLVENCSFRYFFQGAMDLYNCHFVAVRDSIFEHNGPVAIVKLEQYRGHSGGLSFGYVRLMVEGGPRVLVSNCTFRNNTSDPKSVAVQRTSDLLQRFVFTGRGGGCVFIVSPYTPLVAVVENSTFEENFARSFGGGLYLGLNGSLDHSVTVDRVKFIRNVCSGAGGGLHIGFADGRGDSITRLFIFNSEFIENYATFGGGMYYMSADAGGTLSNSALFQNCTFTGNRAKEYGTAFGVVNIRDMVNIEFDDCVFERNDGGRGGVLSTAYTTLTFRGNSSFIQNRGRALVVIGAYIEIRGGISFVENNGAGIDGGAVYITSLGQLKLFRGANITFTGNTGVIGAAIVIDALPVPPVYSRLIRNPLCTLLYEDSTQRPDDWENVSLVFYENTAIVASGVYLNNLDLCSWTLKQSPWFEPHNVFKWKFVEYSESNRNSAHDPDGYNQDWSVQTSAVDIQITSNVTVAYPGEQIQLGIQALDEIGRSTSDIIRITDLSNNAAYRFDPSTITINNITLAAVNTSYLSPTKDIEYMSSRKLQVETLLGSTTFANAELQSRKCLPGYVLSLSHGSYRTCQCDISNPHILECNGADILLNAGLWATTDSYSTRDTVVMYPCPSGYCRCVPITEGNSIQCQSVYRSTDPDSQCSCKRKGDLCGECKDGKGVSALLNRCTNCSDVSGLLIALLLLLDAVVFAVLLVIMKPLPTWVYPCVFYIQVLPYLTEHFPTTFDQIQPPLYYISSSLSFYFIYDFCLYSNMSPLVSYFLRYLPMFLAIVVVGSWFALMSKFRKRPQNWNGLWWIVMLMYTHVVHTSMSILNCPTLPGRDGSHEPWYVSGNVKCFSRDHAGLGLLAIIILTLCVVVIPLSLAYNMEWIKHPRLLKHVFEPLMLPFKQKYRWWASVDLGRRILLVLFVISIPQNEYPVTILLMIILTLYGFIQPYREIAINVLEVVFSVNVIILLLLRNTQTVEEAPSITHTTSECIDNQSIKITAFTWILFPFYYSSLIIMCIVATVWIALELRFKIKARWYPQTTFHLVDSSMWTKQVSTTEVVMNMNRSNQMYREMVDCDDFADIVIINSNT